MIDTKYGHVNTCGPIPELIADACCVVGAVIETIREDESLDDDTKESRLERFKGNLQELFSRDFASEKDEQNISAMILMGLIKEALKGEKHERENLSTDPE
jgi:DNA gyrase/topoisomerase IV subunit A